jgi:FixJ family two-component response regulator
MINEIKPMAGRVLIADDDASFLEATAGFLRLQGYSCVCVPDAAAAADKLAGSEFDLLISDLDMPGNANLELIRRLPQIAAGLPVILATGHPTLHTAVDSIQLPVMAYLIKPMDPDEMLRQVRRAVDGYRACRAVQMNRQRIQTWYQELEQIESVMRNPSASSAVVPWQAFLKLTLQNIMAAMMDLKMFTEAVVQQQDPEFAKQLMDSSRPLLLIDALRETVTVLEKSRGAFKSKELGDLRKKLENLI